MAGSRQFGAIDRLPSGRYRARYRAPDGQRYTASTTFTAKKTASAWLSKIQADIERDIWKSPGQIADEEAAAEAAAAAHRVTIRGLAETWLATIPSANHRVMSTSRVRRFVNPALGDLAVADLTRERCEQWYAALCPDHPAQRTRTYAALNTILHLAVDRGLISSSPLRVKGALDDIPLREPQTASVGQVDALAAAMPAHLAMAVHLAAWCGLRAGEVLGLQRGDVTADSAVPASGAPVVRLALRRHLVHGRGTGGMKIVPGAKSDKRAATVVVPPHLVPPLHAHLDAHAGPSPTAWLFPSTRNRESPCAPTALHRHWDHARTKTKLTHLTFHDLRRTGNTLAAESGATPGEMKERLRHRTSKAAERYIVSAQGADVRLAARMSERLAPAVDPVEAEVKRRVAERLAELGIEP